MDMSKIISRVRNTLGGHDQDVLRILDDSLLYTISDQCVLEFKLEVRRPIKTYDIVCVAGERGVLLPDDFMQLADPNTPARLITTSDDAASEGVEFPLLTENNLQG